LLGFIVKCKNNNVVIHKKHCNIEDYSLALEDIKINEKLCQAMMETFEDPANSRMVQRVVLDNNGIKSEHMARLIEGFAS
jgi:hypothetical protein